MENYVKHISNLIVCYLFSDETGRNEHPSTPAGLYETMNLPDETRGGSSGKGEFKYESDRVLRRRVKEEMKRRKVDVETEVRVSRRIELKRRKIVDEGEERVS